MMPEGRNRKELVRLASTIARCSGPDAARHGWRCGLRACPRCIAILVRQRARRLHQWLRGFALDRLVMLTLSAPCECLVEGTRALRAALTNVRAALAWRRAVLAGVGAIDPEPAESPGATWNLHAHVALVLHVGEALDVADLERVYLDHLASNGFTGQVHARAVDDRWALACYVVRAPRRSWLRLDGPSLLDLVGFLPGRRLALRFGRRDALRLSAFGSDGGADPGDADGGDRDPLPRDHDGQASTRVVGSVGLKPTGETKPAAAREPSEGA